MKPLEAGITANHISLRHPTDAKTGHGQYGMRKDLGRLAGSREWLPLVFFQTPHKDGMVVVAKLSHTLAWQEHGFPIVVVVTQ